MYISNGLRPTPPAGLSLGVVCEGRIPMASMCHLKCVALWTLKDECGVTMTVDDASIMVAQSSRIDAEILKNVSKKYEK